MYRFAWSKEVLNYLKDNEGLVNKLELAFADLRKSATGMPTYGIMGSLMKVFQPIVIYGAFMTTPS